MAVLAEGLHMDAAQLDAIALQGKQPQVGGQPGRSSLCQLVTSVCELKGKRHANPHVKEGHHVASGGLCG